MKRRSGKMWSFKTKNFHIVWTISPCTDLDLSWCETGETRENLRSGLWVAFDSAMTVYFRGEEIAADYLGQSIYENPAEFRDHIGLAIKRRADGCNYGSYFSDMVREAIREARDAMARKKNPEPLPRMRNV